jgi:hypothetical protein
VLSCLALKHLFILSHSNFSWVRFRAVEFINTDFRWPPIDNFGSTLISITGVNVGFHCFDIQNYPAGLDSGSSQIRRVFEVESTVATSKKI